MFGILPWSEKPLRRKTSVHIRLQMEVTRTVYTISSSRGCEQRGADCPWPGDKAMKPLLGLMYLCQSRAIIQMIPSFSWPDRVTKRKKNDLV